MDALIQLGVVLVLMALGFFVGRAREAAHFKSIREREARLAGQPVVTLEDAERLPTVTSCRLVTGTAVISVDYYKVFLAGLRQFFGGEVRSYSSLIDRARREAILRMKESAPEAELFFNVHLQTSSINDGVKQQAKAIEVIAYSTALVFDRTAATAGSPPPL